MAVIDLVVGVVIVAGAIAGARLGFAAALPIAGFAAGAVLGTRVPQLVGEDLDSDFALVIAVPAALVLGGVVGAFSEMVTSRLARRARAHPLVDVAGGALFAGAAAVVLVWALAPAVSELRAAREPIADSELLGGFNGVLQPAGATRRKEPPPIDVLPTFAGRTPTVAPGSQALLFDDDVLRAERSVVKIWIRRCGGQGSGSGWIAGDGIVVTNAHVASAASSLQVQLEGKGERHEALPIWFDGIHDLAILRVPTLRGVRALRLAQDTRPRIPGVELGFPGGREALGRARLGPTTAKLRGEMQYGDTPGLSPKMTGRLVTVASGGLGPGSSGGPIVDADGEVIGTIFGGNALANITFAVPNRIVRHALGRAKARVRLPGCDDPPLDPTRAELARARAV